MSRGLYSVLLLATLAAVASPFGSAEVQGVVSFGVAVIALFVSFFGIRARRSGGSHLWWLMFASLAAIVAGVVAREIHAAVSGVDYPLPSPADGFVALGFMFLLGALSGIVRSRSRRGERAQYIDMWLVSVAVASLYWALILNVVLADEVATVAEKALTFLFAGFDVALIAFTTRLLVGPGIRNRALVLLTSGICLLVASDFAVALDLTRTSRLAWLIAPLASFGFIAAAAALSDSHLGEVLVERPQVKERIPRLKLIALAVAALTPVLLLGFGSGDRWFIDGAVRLIFAVSGVALVGARMLGLIRIEETKSGYERIIADMASSHGSTTSPESIAHSSVVAAEAILGAAGGSSIRMLYPCAQRDGFNTFSVSDAGWKDEEVFVTRSELESFGVNRVVPGSLSAGSSAQFVHADGSSIVLPTTNSEDEEAFLWIRRHDGLLISPDQLAALRNVAVQHANSQRVVALQILELDKKANQRLQKLTEQSSSVVLVLDDDARIIFGTTNADAVLGRSIEQLVGSSLSDLVFSEHQASFSSCVAAAAISRESVETEVLLEIEGAPDRWFGLVFRDHRDRPDIAGMVVTAVDIHDRRISEQRVLRSEARFRSLVQRSSDVVAIADEQGFFTYVSPAALKVMGYEPGELLGTNVFELMSAEIVTETADLRSRFANGVADQEAIDVRTAAKDGSWRYLNVTITDLTDDPAVDGFVLNVRDDTQRLSLERNLRHQATHDSLTKLANRTQFADALEDVLVDQKREDELIGVLFIDLDDFKVINDGLGHATGDQVLVAVAERLRKVVRLSDVVARFGGDEFAVLLSRSFGEHEAIELAGRLVDELSKPLPIDGRNLTLGASVGIAFDRQRTLAADELIKRADVAMYASKDRGKGRVTVFNDSMMTTAGGRLDLIESLRVAIDEQQLVVHYQPIVNMKTERIVGFEALVRWNHPERGMISPAGFIPVAEETGLIVPLGLQVLEDAAAQLSSWIDLGHDIYVSVNVSVKQLQTPTIVDELSTAVSAAGLDFNRIMLEVTESVFVADRDLVADRLAKLRKRGFRIAIDDFGTGYSSLQYLQQFEFDVLKIDKSFVDRLGTDDDTGVVQTVIDLAKRIGATTVAEGIEGAGQATELRRLRCELGQGYYYARPMSADLTGEALAAEPLPLRNQKADNVAVDATELTAT